MTEHIATLTAARHSFEAGLAAYYAGVDARLSAARAALAAGERLEVIAAHLGVTPEQAATIVH